MHFGLPLAAAILALGACTSQSPSIQSRDETSIALTTSAAALYEAYGRAVTTPERAAIASFYARDGVIRVLNGTTVHTSRAALDSMYRGRWSPPAYFSWDSLAFDSLSPTQVLVIGGFRWQASGQPDTTRWLYAGLLEAADSRLVIRFEHETMRPTP